MPIPEGKASLEGVFGNVEALNGSFLVKGHFFYDKYNEKFNKRLEYFQKLFEAIRSDLIGDYPELKGLIDVSYSHIITAMIRYFNDLIKLRTFNNLSPANRPKIISNTIKWFNFYPPLVCVASPEEFQALSSESRKIIYALKAYSVIPIFEYFFNEKNGVSEEITKNVFEDLMYTLEIGDYESKCISIALRILEN